MPGIKLDVRRHRIPPELTSHAPPPRFPRLHARLLVEPYLLSADQRPKIVVDTGCPITVFPFHVWALFDPASYTFLPPKPLNPFPMLGGQWYYEFGRLEAGLADTDGRKLPSVEMYACFLDQFQLSTAKPPSVAFLGLSSPLFEKRRLRHSIATGTEEWWLEDHP